MSVFCSLPFNSVQILNTGTTMPCCAFSPTKKITLNEYFQSSDLLSVKESFINGKFPVQCKNCEQNEKTNNTIYRKLNSLFDSEEESIKAVGATYNKIKHLSLMTSNICNLKCLPCIGGSYIRMVEMEKLKIHPAGSVLKLSTLTRSAIDEIAELDSIESLTLTGGEPFVDPVAIELIDKLVDCGKSKNIRIDINTNLTMITNASIEKLKNNFKQVYIKGSIDGLMEVNEYLRYPSKWEDIVKSIELIRSVGLDFVVTTAMSNLSLMRYYELLEWGLENNILDMFQSVVDNVPILNPTSLPLDIKRGILEKYLNLKKHIKSDRTMFVLDSCISMCESKNDDSAANLIEYLKKHDDLRGTDYSKLWPELKQYE
jgi:sulfatase maturation enzyme AslB (radical SAM superfamily)